MRIDLFSNTSGHQYGVQKSFTEALQAAFHRNNVESSIYSYNELGEGKVIGELVKNRPDCTAGFNVTVAKHSPLEPLSIAHLSMILDSASYFPELLHAPNSIVSFVDEDCVSFFKLLGKKHVFYLPHACTVDFGQNLHLDRDLDIVLLGSYFDKDEVLQSWQEHLSPKAVDSLLDIAERALASATHSHLELFVKLVEEKGAFEKELVQKSINYFDILSSIELYMRAVDRIGLLEAIDYPIHIFGAKKYEASWKKAIRSSKKCIFHPEVSFSAVPDILLRTRICINSVPTYKRGLHERLLLALACGSSVLTNDNVKLQEAFGASSALLPYLYPNYEKVNSLIEATLSDEGERKTNAVATHDILRRHHSWDARAKYLVELLPPILAQIQDENQGGISHLF